jgi:hypothetical protein
MLPFLSIVTSLPHEVSLKKEKPYSSIAGFAAIKREIKIPTKITNTKTALVREIFLNIDSINNLFKFKIDF